MVTRNALIVVLVLLPWSGSLATAQEPDPTALQDVLRDLASEDPAARSAAATAAAELDAGAIAPIGTLLAEASPAVTAAVRRALWGIAAAACRPGRPDREAVAGALLDLAEGGSAPLAWPDRGLLLRMVATVARDAASARRVGAFLDHETLWTYALFALQRMPGDGADQALLRCLEKGGERPPPAAVVSALGARGARAGVSALIRLATKPDAPLAAPARRALALMGEPRAEKVMTGAVAAATPGASCDLILWLDRRRERGAALESLRPLYQGRIGDDDPAVRLGALAGLAHLDGKDSGLLEVFVAALRDPSPAVARGAEGILMARRIPGTDAALLDLYRGAEGEPLRSRLLGIVARRESAGWEGLVLAEARDPASSARLGAVELLGSVDDPEALSLLRRLVASEAEDLRDLAVRGLVPQGEHLATQGDPDAARGIWLAALAATDDEAVAGEILACLLRHPDPAVLEVADRFAATPGLRERVCELRIAVAKDIEEGDPDGCRALLERAFLESRSRGNRLAIARRLEALGEDAKDLLRSEGFLTEWKVLGPLPASTEENFAANPFGPGGPDGEEVAIEGEGNLGWKAIRGGSVDGTFDLTYLEPNEHREIYALAELDWPEDAEVTLLLGSDDAVCVWVNGELVHEKWAWRGVNIDEDRCTARLRKGRNRVLLKVLNGGGGWGFCLRIPPR